MTRSFHFIGIGGAGMSVVAELLAARGCAVSGSDRSDSAALTHLKSVGIDARVGHSADAVPPEAVVVVSTAVRESNPELQIARRRGQDVIHRSQALALAASGMDFVAVAGAHGKTTTSGMLTVALMDAGIDPSAAVGAPIVGMGSGARMGAGRVFVAEADESDGSFLNYTPTVELVTNIEPDHLDRYGSTEAFEQVFRDFVDRLVDGGLLVCCAEDPGAAALARYAQSSRRVVTYGRPEKSVITPDVVISNVTIGADSASAHLAQGDTEVELRLSVPGKHNILNATGAWIVGCDVGVDPHTMAASLGAFRGTSRRFELRGEVQGRRLYDDYAHHPTEVAAAIAQARLAAQGAGVVVVFQPHLFSRTQAFADRFAEALSGADHVIVADIYAAREDPMPGVDSSLISSKIPGGQWIPDMYEAARRGAELTPPGGLMVLMGAGDITLCAPSVLAWWDEHQ